MRSLRLTPEARDVLAFICRTEFPLSVYGRSAGRVWPMVRGQVSRRINSFGVPVHEVNIYKRYVAEMLKVFRNETGEPLAAADLVDYYEAKSLDGGTLRAIAATVFDIDVAS